MEISRVTAAEYQQLFPNPEIVFNCANFSELNKEKCEDLHYLIFRNNKLRLGITIGEKEDILRCPFSAPFSTFVTHKKEPIEYYFESAVLLKDYATALRKPLMATLPPTIYGSEVSKTYLALQHVGARLQYTDLNYHYNIDYFAHYEDYLARNTRKHYNASRKRPFVFTVLDSNEDKEVMRAYEVIKRNRKERGYPLHMSLQNVLDTIKIIPAEFFVMSYEGVDVAAAQVFRITNQISQVIYWGDIPEYSHLRTMNYFTYKLFEFYKNTSIRILDIGPSSEAGVPNYGLCDFKEGIGCELSMKHTLLL